MGIGDEIMVAGEVKKRVARGEATRFRILDVNPRKPPVRWHDVWEGNPLIARMGEPYDGSYLNCPGHREYIADKTLRAWKWKPYGPTPADLYFQPYELNVAREHEGKGIIVIQTEIKDTASPNKRWPRANWQTLVELYPQYKWVQIGTDLNSILRGVEFVPTLTFKQACAMLKVARAAVLQEGGLHHAAAALGTPSVVIFGGFISPLVTGYAAQRSLFVEDPKYRLGCGSRVPCVHCEMAMKTFTPRMVGRELKLLIGDY